MKKIIYDSVLNFFNKQMTFFALANKAVGHFVFSVVSLLMYRIWADIRWVAKPIKSCKNNSYTVDGYIRNIYINSWRRTLVRNVQRPRLTHIVFEYDIGNFSFATATKSSTTTRFFLLNICYYKLCIVLSLAYHIFIITVCAESRTIHFFSSRDLMEKNLVSRTRFRSRSEAKVPYYLVNDDDIMSYVGCCSLALGIWNTPNYVYACAWLSAFISSHHKLCRQEMIATEERANRSTRFQIFLSRPTSCIAPNNKSRQRNPSLSARLNKGRIFPKSFKTINCIACTRLPFLSPTIMSSIRAALYCCDRKSQKNLIASISKFLSKNGSRTHVWHDWHCELRLSLSILTTLLRTKVCFDIWCTSCSENSQIDRLGDKRIWFGGPKNKIPMISNWPSTCTILIDSYQLRCSS